MLVTMLLSHGKNLSAYKANQEENTAKKQEDPSKQCHLNPWKVLGLNLNPPWTFRWHESTTQPSCILTRTSVRGISAHTSKEPLQEPEWINTALTKSRTWNWKHFRLKAFPTKGSFSVGTFRGNLVLQRLPRGHCSSLRHHGVYLPNPLWRLVAQLWLTLRDPMDCNPTRLLCPWNSPGKNTGVGCHALLQRIFPTQGSNPGLQHCREILHHLSHQESPWFTVTGQWWPHTSSRTSKLLKKFRTQILFMIPEN